MRRGSIAACAAWLICLAFAQPAEASRPFDWAVLHKGTDPNRLRLVVRTTTGIEKPKRLQLRFQGEGIAARELKGSVGRWAVGEKTARERSFAVAVAEHMDLFGQARIRAIGRYQGSCNSTFRVLFKLEELNVRDDEARFLKATSCDRAQSRSGGGAGLFRRPYRSISVKKDGEPRDLVDGTSLKVEFAHERGRDVVRWSSGCNNFGAEIVLVDGRVQTTDPPDNTLELCRRRAQRQDDFFANFFKRDPAYVTQGNGLTLSTDRVKIKLRRTPDER